MFNSTDYTLLADSISEASAVTQLYGLSPSPLAIRPGTLVAMLVAKESTGPPLSGNYLDGVPSVVRGLPPVLSPSIAAGNALLINPAFCPLGMLSDVNIQIALSGYDFTKNLVTILAELRFLPTYRAVGSALLMTPKP